MELFFNEKATQDSDKIEFDDFESKHILKSKRKKNGDEIHFTNGTGDLFKGTIEAIKPNVECSCTWLKNYPKDKKGITMAVGFIRPNRLDFLIEKITELGIHKIILFGSQNGNYHTDNTERWKKITRQAIKQSIRYYLPVIETMDNFTELLNCCQSYDGKFIAEQNTKKSISEFGLKDCNDVIYIIGPEGGLTSHEIKSAVEIGFNPVKIGNYRLRTETAALAFGAIVSTIIN